MLADDRGFVPQPVALLQLSGVSRFVDWRVPAGRWLAGSGDVRALVGVAGWRS